MEKYQINNIIFTISQYKEQIVIPTTTTVVKEVKLKKYKINQEKNLIEEQYRFIDLEKLRKIKGKSYKVSELREIAKKIGIDPDNKKTVLVELIKEKIKVK